MMAGANARQPREKGFGPALGPTAAAVAVARFTAVGYAVTHDTADWVIGPRDRDMQNELLTGWAGAGRERAPPPFIQRDHRLADAPARPGRGRPLIDPRRSRRFPREPDRQSARRQIAVEQHLAVELVKPHGRTQRVVAMRHRRKRDAAAAGAQDDRRDHDVKTIQAAGRDET